MITSTQKVIENLNVLQSEVVQFLKQHSSLYRSNYPGDGWLTIEGNHRFRPLKPEAVPIQNGLYKRLNQLAEVICILLINSIEKHYTAFEKSKAAISNLIVQEYSTWNESIEEVINDVIKNFEEIIATINDLYPDHNPEPILIPDTNALYMNENIEFWNYVDFKKFTILITPSVLKDLDKHKIEHRNEAVRNKAIKLINKIKEYRRRGKLTEGVQIVTNKIFLITKAIEPDFERTLSWLDRNNEDDRLIAESFEVIRQFADRPVFLITSDINLQNKCEVADLIFFEPPERNA